MILGQGDEPQRQLGEVHRHGVAVHAVEAALGDQAAGEDHRVLVGRDVRHGVVRAPGIDQRVGELPARFDQEGAGAHRGIADLQIEDPLGQPRDRVGPYLTTGPPLPLRRRGPLSARRAFAARFVRLPAVRPFSGRGRRRAQPAGNTIGPAITTFPGLRRAQPAEDRLQRRAHDRLGQFAGCVVRAGAPPFLVRLQHHRAGRHQVGCRVLVDDGVEGGVQQVVERVQHLFGQPFADLVLVPTAVLEQRGETLVARRGEQTDLAEQQAQRRRDRPAGGLHHVAHAEIEPAGAFAARGRDEAQRDAVEEQTGRYAVWRNRRSRRPCGDASRPPLPRTTRSRSSPGSHTWTRSCQAGLSDVGEAGAAGGIGPAGAPSRTTDADANPAPGAGADPETASVAGAARNGDARTAKSGRSIPPASGSAASSSAGIGASSVPA